MLAPAIAVTLVFGPFPVIGVNLQPKLRLVFHTFAHMPAIAIVIANDLGRRRRSGECDDE